MYNEAKEVVDALIDSANECGKIIGTKKTIVFDNTFKDLLEEAKDLVEADMILGNLHAHALEIQRLAYTMLPMNSKIKPYLMALQTNLNLLADKKNAMTDILREQKQSTDTLAAALMEVQDNMVNKTLPPLSDKLIKKIARNKTVKAKVDDLLKGIDTFGKWIDLEEELRINADKYREEIPISYMEMRMNELGGELQKKRSEAIQKAYEESIKE